MQYFVFRHDITVQNIALFGKRLINAHLADQMISIDLDDGVKKNYAIFQDVLAKIK